VLLILTSSAGLTEGKFEQAVSLSTAARRSFGRGRGRAALQSAGAGFQVTSRGRVESLKHISHQITPDSIL
jgi:hypothetical protein